MTAKVTDLLDEAGLAYEIYSGIKANPTIENVKEGVEAFRKAGADYIIAIGGGSSMDTSKAIGIIINNPEFADVRSLEGVAPTKKPCVPILAVPTTAGTAAEVTINYVITDVERKRKFVCVDPHDMPVVAIVDPDMMSSMPKGLTASTGMDALTHAIEGYITKAAWEMTDMFHLKAIEIISKSLRGAVANTKEGREGMALGQYIAGMGFSNVGLGIAHSMAHTLGAVYDTPHGVACAMMLPIVMAYNAECTGEKYREIRPRHGRGRRGQHEPGRIPQSCCGRRRKAFRRRGHPRKAAGPEGRGSALPGGIRLRGRLPPGQPEGHECGGSQGALPQADVTKRQLKACRKRRALRPGAFSFSGKSSRPAPPARRRLHGP